MSLLITFDGPKGVGKTTLLQLVAESLRSGGYRVDVFIEKDLMSAYLGESIKLAYEELKASPSSASDSKIAMLHKQGRVFISKEKMRNSLADIILIDRWYPSDAVFRKYIDIKNIINENINAGVMIADICFAVTCAPDISWQRAHGRNRQLDSKVIKDFDEHIMSTNQFDKLAKEYGWYIIRSDSKSSSELSDVVCSEIISRLSQTQ